MRNANFNLVFDLPGNPSYTIEKSLMIVKVKNSSGAVIGYIDLACCLLILYNIDIGIYHGAEMNEDTLLWKVKACKVNTHVCFGKKLGAFCKCARNMVFRVYDKN